MGRQKPIYHHCLFPMTTMLQSICCLGVSSPQSASAALCLAVGSNDRFRVHLSVCGVTCIRQRPFASYRTPHTEYCGTSTASRFSLLQKLPTYVKVSPASSTATWHPACHVTSSLLLYYNFWRAK